MAVNSPLYMATAELVAAEKSLEKSRTVEAKQLRQLKKQTDTVKDAQKDYENSLKESVRAMSFADLGKQLKNDLLSPLEGLLNSLPAPVKTLGMMAMKPFLKQEEEGPAGPGFRFNPEEREGKGAWRSFDEEKQSYGGFASVEKAEAAGASIEAHSLPMSDYKAAQAIEKSEDKEQTGLLESIKESLLKMVKGTKKPDASKLTEAALEKDTGVADVQGDDKEGGGLFGSIGKAFKKIKGFIKKFITWKGMLVLLIGSIIGGLAIKYWEPIKNLVLEIKDKIMGIYNTIKEWFVSLWTWGLEAGTDEEGKWSVTTFITNIWDTIKKWFESLWTWASDGIAAGWTTVTNYIKGIWDTVYGWFTGLWSWASDGIAKGWTNLTTYIKGIWDTVYGWFTGLWSWASDGIAAGWTNLTTYISEIWTKVKKWFTDIFSWGEDNEKETQGEFSFITLIKDAFTGVKEWFGKLFSWAEDNEKETQGEFSFIGLIKDAFTGVKEWFGKLFSFDSAKDVGISAINVLTFVPNMILTMIGKVTTWLLGLFGFDDAAKKVADANQFSIGDLVFKAVDAIAEWFGKIFDIDIGAMFKEMLGKAGEIGSKLWNWMTGGGDDTETQKDAYAEKQERINNLNIKQEQLREKRDTEGLTSDGKQRLAQLDEEVLKERRELRSMPNPFEEETAAASKRKLEIQKQIDEHQRQITEEGDLNTGYDWGSEGGGTGTSRAKIIADLKAEPGITTGPPTTQQAANALQNAGPDGRGDYSSVVDASTSNMATSSSSNTNYTIVNRMPVGSNDPYTSKQYRKFRGMRGGGG